jgi:hypothetical protein
MVGLFVRLLGVGQGKWGVRTFCRQADTLGVYQLGVR